MKVLLRIKKSCVLLLGMAVLALPLVLIACEKKNNLNDLTPSGSFARDILNEHNYVRTKPREYAEKYVKPVVETSSAMKELYAELLKTEPCGPMVLNGDLSKYAQEWANYLAANNAFQHNLPLNKIYKVLPNARYIGENISAGLKDPHAVMLQLLEDKGISSRGHRRNILNPRFNTLGVGFTDKGPNPYGCATVLDYAEVGK